MSLGEKFERAVAIMARLREPGGCPWDREQNFDSIKRYTVEETYEVLEAIDNRDWQELPSELGDLLLQVLFYARMASEEGRFDIGEVLDRLCEKLIHRHPHVFADVEAPTSADVLRNWEDLKKKEKSGDDREGRQSEERGKPESLLEGVSLAQPGFLAAHRLSSKASLAGFDWPNLSSLLEKLDEESSELKAELRNFPVQNKLQASQESPAIPEDLHSRIAGEIGDLLFVIVNIGRHLGIDPDSSLRATNRKFKKRFQWLEAQLRQQGRTLEDVTLDEMEALWQSAKQQEVGS